MVIVVIGPMGCGKTTIGQILARKLDWKFYDGDDFHPESNRRKMAGGIPLEDADRLPWLEILRALIERHRSSQKDMVLACSALKRKYRQTLGIDQDTVVSVFLKGSASLLEKRITERSHEFMEKGLLQSQLDTLEEPRTGITVSIVDSPEQISQTIIKNISGLHKP